MENLEPTKKEEAKQFSKRKITAIRRSLIENREAIELSLLKSIEARSDDKSIYYWCEAEDISGIQPFDLWEMLRDDVLDIKPEEAIHFVTLQRILGFMFDGCEME